MTGWSLELSKKKETVKLKDSRGVGWGEVGEGGKGLRATHLHCGQRKKRRDEMFRERKRT